MVVYKEQWKQTEEFPHILLSNLGRVWDTNKDKERHPQPGRDRVFVGGKNDRFNITKGMMKYWKYEWIKELDDDEECKEIEPHIFITMKGRIYSGHKRRFLVPSQHRGYYQSIMIGHTTYNLHTLVGRTFLADYQPGLHILHKKEDLPYPDINFVENLWVGTPSENSKDMWEKKRHTPNKTDPTTGRFVPSE